jgi:hypothetical protein
MQGIAFIKTPLTTVRHLSKQAGYLICKKDVSN